MLGHGLIEKAFSAMGAHLVLDHDVEILVVGGAAGMLTGELPASWTTQDVDLLHCQLAQDRDAVLDAAAAITQRLGLPPSWMSDFGGLYAWTLPEDWGSRRFFVGQYGRMNVYAVGRLDLIAMKFIAHRTRDLEHLVLMRVTVDDAVFTKRHLDRLMTVHREYLGQLELADSILSSWRTCQ